MRLIPVLLFLLVLTGCNPFQSESRVIALRGNTMGTTYLIKVVDPDGKINADKLNTAVEAGLKQVNARLSNWRPDSEISKFNESTSTDPVKPSVDMSAVLAESLKIHQASNKRFDVTIAPLIKLWGFGPGKKVTRRPDDELITSTLSRIGMSTQLDLTGLPEKIRKISPDVTINLSAIAKGYGVDRISQIVESHGGKNYLVEIGGDLYSKGVNGRGAPWRIGIEKPDTTGRSVHKAINVSNLGVATSGDYRNFVERDGKRYSHIIDPVTGRPITHKLASVTVLSNNAMRADGWATALFVLGDEEGMKVAEKQGLAAYFIVRSEKGFIEKQSPKFKELTK